VALFLLHPHLGAHEVFRVIATRYAYDPITGVVYEVGTVSVSAPAIAGYADALGQWKQRPDEATGVALRDAALERADRRVRAHKRLGDEKRWSE
jgi:hypothetical protein